jgi:amidase
MKPLRASMATFSEYAEHDAVGLAELVRTKQVSSRELVEAAIERIERVNPQLNAVICKTFEQARRAAEAVGTDAPLCGVPFLLKDLQVRLAGVPLTQGSRYWKDYVPDHDSELATRFKRAGLVIVGKANTPEFGLLPTTEPELHGRTHNPWRLGLTAGGSSGGSAAAVASGMVPAAHASDGGGSIRIPASCCGVFGLKPTRGRTPLGPDSSEVWHGFSIDHAVTRSVRDSAALLDATHGPEPTSPYHAPPVARPFLEEVKTPPGRLRIAFSKLPHLLSSVHADAIEAVESAARLCQELGHEVEEATVETDPRAFGRYFFTILCGETAASIALDPQVLGRAPARDELEAPTWLSAMLGRVFSAEELCVAVKELQALSRKAARFFERYDILLTPTLARAPVRLGELHAHGVEKALQDVVAHYDLATLLKSRRLIDRAIERVFDFMPFTPLANVAGLPSMSVPLHWNAEDLPIGTMFTARFGADATLFRLAAQLERARPWKQRRPRVHAFD